MKKMIEDVLVVTVIALICSALIYFTYKLTGGIS